MVYFTILGFQRTCHDQLNTHHRRNARKTQNRTALDGLIRSIRREDAFDHHDWI
jgi:hypothetical protein